MHDVVDKLSQKRKERNHIFCLQIKLFCNIFSTGEQFSHAEISIKIFKRKEIKKTIETVDVAVVIVVVAAVDGVCLRH
jgi:hypothetical protein